MLSYENKWKFNDKDFESEDIANFTGFVYCIINISTGKKYIGRKYFYSIRKVKGKLRRKKIESDWKTYYGSCKELLNDVALLGTHNFKRIILSLHKTRGDTNYQEVKLQFLHNVLEEENWYNENILGKYHRKPDHIREERKISDFRLENL